MAELPKLRVVVDGRMTWLSDRLDDEADSRLATPGDLTAERVADYLDRRAEVSNHHDFAGLHTYLAGLIEEKAGVGAARAVMLELLRKGGLHRVGG